jgi:hypothetical protein
MIPALLFSVLAAPQTLELRNLGAHEWRGWHRTVVATRPPADAGVLVDPERHGRDYAARAALAEYSVVGPSVKGGWIVDARARLPSGAVASFALGHFLPVVRPVPQAPRTLPAGWVLPQVGGTPLALGDVAREGAALRVLLVGTVPAPALRVQMTALWYPDQPGWCVADVAITARHAVTLASALTITMGDAVIVRQLGDPWTLLPAGTSLAAAETRTVRVVIAWLWLQPRIADVILAAQGAIR